MNEINEKYNIAQYISQTCKVPDHSTLQINFKVSNTTNIFSDEALKNKTTTDSNVYQKKQYKFDNVPDLFLMNNIWRQTMVNLMDGIILCRNEQHEIDHVYTRFCNTLTIEMAKYLKYTSSPKSFKKETLK